MAYVFVVLKIFSCRGLSRTAGSTSIIYGLCVEHFCRGAVSELSHRCQVRHPVNLSSRICRIE